MLPGQLLKQTVQGSLRGQPVDSALLALHVLLHVSSEGTVTDGAVAFEGGGGCRGSGASAHSPAQGPSGLTPAGLGWVTLDQRELR